MFRIQAPYGAAARAIEQAEVKCANLNSGDAYLVVAKGGLATYLWLGEGANEQEEAIGGKTEYSSVKDTGIAAGFEPRLFHCSNAHGYFYVQEIFNFS